MARRLTLRRVSAVLGRGALTETLLADVTAADGSAPPQVAVVKRLHPNLVDDRGAVARIAEEARVLARLSHPAIPAFIGVGDDDGLPFFAQVFVDGAPLDAATVLTPPELVVLVLDLASALAVAHEGGVIHRDLSAHNVLVDTRGRGWLIDFGVARADDRARQTRSGAVIGTPAAMAPEQARGQPATAAVDVWALCALAVTWLGAGHPLGIRPDDAVTTRLARARAGHLDVDVRARLETRAPPALAAILRKGLAADPADRHEDARALVRVLEPLRAGVDEAGTRNRLASRQRRTVQPTVPETLDDTITSAPSPEAPTRPAPSAPRRPTAPRRPRR